MSIYRCDNDIVTFSICGPAIIGMEQMFHSERSHYFRCDQVCEMVIIDTNKFIELLNCKGLWFHAFNILSHHLGMYFQLEKRLMQKDIKGIVREHLHYLWKQDPVVRSKASVYTFILARHQVSRSSLHKVMAKLISDGMIELSHGKLVWMHDAY